MQDRVLATQRCSRALRAALPRPAAIHTPAVHGLRRRSAWARRQPAARGAAGTIARASSSAPPQQLVASPPSAASSLVRVAELGAAYTKVLRRLPENAGPESLVFIALRIALAWTQGMPSAEPGTAPPFQRAVQLALDLAELMQAGLPLGTDAVAAAILAEVPHIDLGTIRLRMGDAVAMLVHDIHRVRAATSRVDTLDDVSASSVREACLAFNDVRACVIEVVARWARLRDAGALPRYEQQHLALEALQVYAPMGHALGLSAVCAAMEDASFRVLFPDSYAHTSHLLRSVVEPGEAALAAAQLQLSSALAAHPTFNQLAAGAVIRVRTKSLFSIMKKLLCVGETAKGGRRLSEVFDLLGMRAVVQPRPDLPPEQAEEAAREACYVVMDVARQLWRVMPGRTKDYIAAPKPNGYRSIHLTICLASMMAAAATGSRDGGADGPVVIAETATEADHADDIHVELPVCGSTSPDSTGDVDAWSALPSCYVELQIRTRGMDEEAEAGDASHALYKAGRLDARQARQLTSWSTALAAALAAKPSRQLLLPPAVQAGQLAAPGALDSVDQDAAWDVMPSVHAVNPRNSSSSSSSGHEDDMPSSVRSGSHDMPGAVLGPRGSPAETLFRVIDVNGDGRLSWEELREQLGELGWGSASGSPSLDGSQDPGWSLAEFAELLKQARMLRRQQEGEWQQAPGVNPELQ